MRRLALSISRFLTVVTLGLVMAACGGGGDSSSTPPVTPPGDPGTPGTPSAPTAAFTAPANATANQVVVFDASASTAADGSTLTYVWDFGDGQRGGGKTIARSFGASGARSVTLTVLDGASRSNSTNRTVTVTAPAAGSSVTVSGKIKALDGSPLSGVSVTRVGGGSSATSDATGKVSLSLPRVTTLTLKLSKAGYADQFVQLNLPAATGSDAYFEAMQRPRDAALTLASAAAGGSLTGRDGAGITVPANAFVDASGAPVTGPIQIALTPVDATQPGGGGFPGQFDGIQPDGSTTPIVSFGAVEFIPTSGGSKLQLAPGKTATIEVPIYGAKRPDGTTIAIGDSIPLWSLDETTSMWIQEGTGQAVASTTSPSGLAMRATVSHLSWWNADMGFDPYGAKPDCRAAGDIGIPEAVDNFANATICIMLAEIDRTFAGPSRVNPDLKQAQAAEPAVPRYAGFSRRADVPMGGTELVPVPANVPIRFTAMALNGTWTGTKVVTGPIGLQEQVVIEMRPNEVTGPAPEAVTLPFDAVRTLQFARVDRYSFTANTSQWAHITVTTGDIQSFLQGTVRLLQGSTELGRTAIGNGTIRLPVPANGSYTVEVTGERNVPGGYHIKIETPSNVVNESLGFPFAVTKDIAAFTRYRGSFANTGAASYFVLRNETFNALANLRILGANGTAVASTGLTAPNALSYTTAALAAGNYTAEVVLPDGSAGKASIRGEPTSWLQVADIAAADTSTYRGMIDLVADRNGRPVVGYLDINVYAQAKTAVLRLRRWTGSAWENVGTDQTVALGNGYCSSSSGFSAVRPRMASFAFDANNNPLIVYRVDQETTFPNSTSTTTVRRFANGSWQAVGPDDGKLPLTANNTEYCDDPPMIGLNAANQPVVAYRSSAGVSVQRYDGTSWKGLADATADSFADSGSRDGGFALGFDATRMPWLAMTSQNTVVVRRFNAQSTTWETVGPNGGTVDDGSSGARSFDGGRLVFSAAGTPTLAVFAFVPQAGTGGKYAPVVYRYSGSAWTTSTYPLAATEGALPFKDAVAVTSSGSDIFVGWPQGLDNDWYSPVVQRQIGTTWTPVGGGIGEVPQFTRRGINTAVMVTAPVLLQTSDGLYLATLLRQTANGGTGVATGLGVVLSRKVD